MTTSKKGERHPISLSLFLVLLSMSVLLAPTVHEVGGNPGLIHVPSDYGTIQMAVDAAHSGDTILVANGIYNESVVIDKSLNLTGTSSYGTIINATRLGRAAVTVVNSTDVSVQGFTIVDNDYFNDSLWVTGSSRVTVAGNRMTASIYSNGTYIYSSSDVTVAGNTITGNLYGIAVQGGFDNVVEGNNSTGNTAGLIVSASQGNKITDNVLKRDAFGIRMSASTGNILARNTIANNSFSGIDMENSPGNRVLENDVDFNNAASTTYGIYLAGSINNRIYYNNFRNNSIQVYAVYTPADILQNLWNDSALVNPKGNFWSDYTGTDGDGDGVGDTNLPYPCPMGGRPCSFQGPPGVDYRPLMTAYQSTLRVTALASPDVGLPPLQVSFTGLVIGGVGPYSYNWDLGDGTRSLQQNPTNTYSVLGSFTVTLVVNDSLGAVESDLITISIVAGRLIVHVHGPGQQQLSQANVASVAQPAGQIPLNQTIDTGVATFDLLRPGTYTIRASSTGYSSNTTTVTVSLNKTSVAEITLKRVSSPSVTGLYYLAAGGVAAGIVAVGAFLFYRRRSKNARSLATAPTSKNTRAVR